MELQRSDAGSRARRAVGILMLAGMAAIALVPVGRTTALEGSRAPIKSVTLSTGGLAEIRRTITVDGAAGLGLEVPLDQVNDVLKSLLVHDPAGGVTSMTLDGLTPVEETFRALPLTPGDMTGLPRLLGALQGVAVRVSSGGRTLEGAVLGVNAEPGSRNEGDEPEPLLSIMTAQGQVAVIRLGSDTEVDILDEVMRDRLRMAATVSGQGRIEDMRTITLAVEGNGTREVELDYVVPAPVWKTAYRLILDSDGVARLQAWAVIENATGEDWSDVELTLSSGAPVTIAQRLHDRYWHQRPEIPVLAQSATPPQPDHYGEAVVSQAGLPDEPAMFNAMRTSASAPAAAPVSEPPPAGARAEALEGETAAVYRLSAPVHLRAGQTLSLPFIDTELTGERIALFQPERGEVHPVSALRLENTTDASFPPGIVTVYAPREEGYAGDAQLSGLPAGETRMISFAADRKIEVTTDQGRGEAIYRASLAEGVLRVTSVTRSTTTYSISGALDAPRAVVIEHPRRQGWSFSSDALEASTPTHYRLRAEIEPGGSAQVQATSERTETDSISLLDMDADSLLHWSGQLDDPATASTLAGLAERQREIAQVRTNLSDLDRELENAAASQARIRENLTAVPPGSTLSRRYLSLLEQGEDQIAVIEERREEAERQLAQARDAFTRAIEEL